MTAFALMIPLALTSTRWAIRKLGGKRWQSLHRLIYFSAAAGVIHYIWLVKADLKTPLEFADGIGDAAAFPIGRLAAGTETGRGTSGAFRGAESCARIPKK